MNKTNECLVSLIVPIYNVEQYLTTCLESLINQTYSSLEIILINDGSSDNSDVICQAYATKDLRIKIINKENGGLSDARNYGINHSNGKYLMFVDSDDYLEINAIEKLVKHAEKNDLDIVSGNANRIVGKSVTVLEGGKSTDLILSGEEYLIECIREKKFSVAVWTRMYKTTLIKDNDFYFIKNLLHEDENWTPRVLLAAQRVGYINYSFYNYIIREGSITQRIDKEKHILDLINTCEELEIEYNKMNIKKTNKRILKDYLARLYINTSTLGRYNKSFYENSINKKFPLRNTYFFKTKLEVLIFSLNIELYRELKAKFS